MNVVVLEEKVDFDLEDEESYLTNVERLGITLGSRLWYDFSDDKDWDQKIAELVKGTHSPFKFYTNTNKNQNHYDFSNAQNLHYEI
jgi:hypothetical protein